VLGIPLLLQKQKEPSSKQSSYYEQRIYKCANHLKNSGQCLATYRKHVYGYHPTYEPSHSKYILCKEKEWSLDLQMQIDRSRPKISLGAAASVHHTITSK
jgi:hypothetical protein